jgi:hypothetical protein
LPDVRVEPTKLETHWAVAISVNLTQLFARLQWSAADEREDESVEAPKRTRTPKKKPAEKLVVSGRKPVRMQEPAPKRGRA